MTAGKLDAPGTAFKFSLSTAVESSRNACQSLAIRHYRGIHRGAGGGVSWVSRADTLWVGRLGTPQRVFPGGARPQFPRPPWLRAGGIGRRRQVGG